MRKGKKEITSIYQEITQSMTSVHLAGIAVAIYIISLLPILALSFYAHPSADDFTYGVKTHLAVVSGQGLSGVLKAAWETVCENYTGWQGTFSAIFFFALQPGIFSESTYCLTTFIMICALSISSVILMLSLYKYLFHGKRSHAVLVCVLLLFLQVQKVYNDTEAFYWFNGASYYTLFYSIALLLIAAVISLICSEEKKRWKWLPCCMVLAVLIGGGNYSTALSSLVWIACLAMFLWLQHHPVRKEVTAICVILAVAFAISVAAPGNAVRAASITQNYSPLEAIVQSLLQAAQCIRNWFQLPQVIFLLIVSVFVFHLPIQSKLSFSHPFAVSALLFGIYATQFTPPLYAMANIGADRQVNIYYFSCYWLLFAQLYYWTGWYKKICSQNQDKPAHFTSCNMGTFKGTLVVLCLIGLCFSLLDVTRLHLSQIELTSARALCTVLNGSADDYQRAYQERISLLNTPSEICILLELPDCSPLREDLLDEDPDYWVNYGVAQYYQHEKVLVVKSDSH